MELALSPHELLTTTRAVRTRLDFSQPVARDTLLDCVREALQAPSGSNRWGMQFIIVDDPERRRRLGEIYRDAYDQYKTMDGVYIGSVDKGDERGNRNQQRTARSADYLADHMGEAPAIVIGAIMGRASGPPAQQMALLGSAMPGMWSFMLAARLRGLGTAWTNVHLMREAEVNALLEIPGDRVTTYCMSPVAYTRGTEFKPALRPEPEEVVHWNSFRSS